MRDREVRRGGAPPDLAAANERGAGRQAARGLGVSANALERLLLPAAYVDPAFLGCLREAAAAPELVRQFDRLYGADLSAKRSPIERMVDQATGKLDDDTAAFVAFVHDSIYLRVPDDVIAHMREKALRAGLTPEDLSVMPT